MFSSKDLLILSVVIIVTYAKSITVKNGHSTDLLVTADGTNHTIATDASVPIEVSDTWSGTIWAVPVGSEVLDGPKTKLEFALSAAGDSYYVSLLDGFNLPAKIIPEGATDCMASVCRANILKMCPLANEVRDSSNTVVACRSAPLVMGILCPIAVVTSTINVQSCATATSYLIVFT